ncbi:MAG: hypothetical protein IH969_06405, partial [Candidatus Krumholzibacteriota bacterium]|nr:hypothetical protein [Candidatus Krumholzibacteriota bacterium]
MNRYHQAVTTICTALTLGALGGVFTASATASPVPLSVAAFVTAAATPTSDNPRTLDLREGWHFRWGDSPAGESGSFAWLDEPLTAPDWTPTKKLVWSVEGPDGIGTIWLRIRLPKTRWKTPTLYLPHIPEAFEAYVGTERVAKRGVFVEGANKYALSGVTIVPLGPDYAGKVLTLRIYSSVHGDIGPQTDGDPVTIGSAHSVMVSVLRRSLETTLFGLAACFLGLVSLLISFRRLAAKKHL